jgi:glycosyltransferase involved in cell wall biosynthesis
MKSLVTIIVTTKNEEKNIENCYKAVHNQTIPRDKLEIVLIDNSSTDRTKEISKPYVDEIYNVGPERSAQRNYGFEHAKSNWVLYLDADMRIEPTVIEECLAAVENNPEIIGIYVPEKVVGEGFWINVRNFERSFYDATCIDAARFIKKEAFLGIGGFDTSMSGPEDWDLDRRLLEKGKLALIKSHLNHDEGAFSFKTYFGKKKYYAKSFDTYAKKWNNDGMVKKQLGFYYRFIGVFIENGKWKKLISHPFLAFGMYFLRFLVGITFLKSKL